MASPFSTDPSIASVSTIWFHLFSSFMIFSMCSFQIFAMSSSIKPNRLFLFSIILLFHRRNGVGVGTSVSQSVDLGSFPKSSRTKRFQKMIFTASLLSAQHNRDSMENKPASFLVVSLGKAFNRMPPSLCGRQMVVPSSLPVVVAPV